MFQGFSQQTGDFIWGLAMNNNRTWFMEHKEEYETFLNQPFRALAGEVLERMRARWPEAAFQTHISRIYRDARRLFGRGPYKDRLWFTLFEGDAHAGGPVFWFEIEGTGYSLGVGAWEASADMMAMYRARIDADTPRFERIIDGLADAGEYILYGEQYRRMKADRGAKLNPWYNRRNISVGQEFGFGGALFSPDLPAVLADAFDRLMPMYAFLSEVHARTLAARAAQLDSAKE